MRAMSDGQGKNCTPPIVRVVRSLANRIAVASRFMKALVMSPKMNIATGNAEPCRTAAMAPSTMKTMSRKVA